MNEARKAGIVFQRQDPLLCDNLNAAGNVFFHRLSTRRRWPRIVDPYEMREECATLFAKLGLPIDPGAPVSSLGYTQRLLILAVQTFVAESPGAPTAFKHPAEAMARGLALIPEDREHDAVFHFQDIIQNMVIARWLMSLCRIFIMDEPTRGIDAAARIDIYNAMNDLVSKGASIILISSDVDEIHGMCDRVLVLARGKMVCDLARGQASKERIIDYASG